VERRAILFAGAGLSMTVGLPSWDELIEHMAAELEIEGAARRGREYTHHTLAEYYQLKVGSIGPLRSWMDRKWKVSDHDLRDSTIHKLIIDLDFPIIYTTNYDRNLEAAFDLYGRDYVKVANARDIAKIREEVTQIVKFHGDFEDDASLVITETDYFNRLSFDTPLDIKLLSDALGKTVLFVGYSMSDMNIRLLLHRLWLTWRRSGYENDRPRSFIFMPHRDALQETVLAQWGITALGREADNPQRALTDFLAELKAAVDQERPDVK
jgi:hypothetical protein